MNIEHKRRPEIPAGGLIAHFQWNYGWGNWEQVIPEAAGEDGVIAAHLLPAGTRQDVITYSVKDGAGTTLARGLTDETKAADIAAKWVEDHPEAIIERVTYVAFTHRETIRTVEANEEPA